MLLTRTNGQTHHLGRGVIADRLDFPVKELVQELTVIRKCEADEGEPSCSVLCQRNIRRFLELELRRDPTITDRVRLGIQASKSLIHSRQGPLNISAILSTSVRDPKKRWGQTRNVSGLTLELTRFSTLNTWKSQGGAWPIRGIQS